MKYRDSVTRETPPQPLIGKLNQLGKTYLLNYAYLLNMPISIDFSNLENAEWTSGISETDVWSMDSETQEHRANEALLKAIQTHLDVSEGVAEGYLEQCTPSILCEARRVALNQDDSRDYLERKAAAIVDILKGTARVPRVT